MARFLITLAASSIAALMAFRRIYTYDSLYPLKDGVVIGAVFFGFVKLVELATKRRFPAWLVITITAVLTAAFYWAFTIAMMI